MIRFSCPSCKSVLNVPEQNAGSKGPCPKCGQRLLVPRPPRSQTVLGELLPPASSALPVGRANSVVTGPAPPRPSPSLLRWLIGAGVTAVILILILCGAGVTHLVLMSRPGGGDAAPGKGTTEAAVTEATAGDLRMSILMVGADGGGGVLYVLAENVSDGRLINFIDDPAAEYHGFDLKVTDELGNNYRRPWPLNHPTIGLGVVAMRPGEYFIFELPIMEPVEKAKSLSVELPSLVVDSKSVFRYRLPLKADQVRFVRPIEPSMIMFFGGGGDWRSRGEVTEKALYMRGDCREWFEKWNRLVTKKPDDPEGKEPKGEK
jgi:predicted RNA-binding Zn-ribbon protein involved in translation (DUF1610 family)